ncbi:MAG TPA: SDR family NAD(P)-dependent oxidoreductase [Solirubrobacterales bacterium]|jgi:NADP-dependent 3-hydroxy acid dehydrogenase YdfG|nr:SDR family NAD(P)-dependent oxidoreductase [Solirubrobacterales bacterium]
MPGAMEGRVAAITGASSGIGEATAVALADEGAAVALAARRRDRLEDLAKRISGDGGTAEVFEVDLAEEESARGFITEASERLGGLDVLVNNAGVMLLGAVQGADTEHWKRMVDVNCLGLLYCTHAAMPLMQEHGGGHIVNVASVAGRHAALGAAVYNMTKFGVVGFSEALRQEALHSNIRVTVIEPGFVATELQGHNEDPVVVEATQRYRDEIGEVLEAEDIADAILYAVTRPPRVSLNEVLVRPTRQRR